MNTLSINRTVDHHAAVAAILDAGNVRFTAEGGHRTKRDDWDCFEWRVTLKVASKPPVSLPYYCGLGHVKPQRFPVGHALRGPDRPEPPKPADVLSSLLLDSTAAGQSFNDWCADFGYDSDSIKALGVYQACCASAETLRKLFTREQLDQLRTALEDY